MKLEVMLSRLLSWPNKWRRGLILLLECLHLLTNGANTAKQKTPPRHVPDLTGQINKESFQYPIAQGSFADVWKCVCMHPALEVAVKCLRIEIQDDDRKKEITERLERELQQNSQLKHKNLLPLLGTTQDFSPLPAIVSPWMANSSLTIFLERNFQQLTLTRKLQILNDIASALQYLHSENIVHGDLTGSNILIDKEGNAFVADQGIFILCSELNGTSYISNNVRWTAPENFQVSEDGSSTPMLPSDIYSFGCVMLQVLTGKVPFSECRSDHQVTVKILRGNQPERPVNPRIEDSLWEFILRCWLVAECRPSAKDVVDFIQRQLELKVSEGYS